MDSLGNSRGKNTLIACAVAAALGSTAAFALPPTATIDYTLYAAGGSAQTNAFFAAANRILNSVDSYTHSNTSATCVDASDYRIVTGTVAASFTFNGVTVPAGKNVLYYYKFNGGSQPNGIIPQVGGGSTLTYPTVASVTGTAVPCNPLPTNAGAPTYFYTSTLGNTQHPDWGVADVEPTLFQGFNNGSTSGTAANTDGGPAPAPGATTGIYDNLFGIAVTANLFSQKSNFTKGEMAGILAGTVTDWSQLVGDNGSPLPAGNVVLLDRGEGSGTKASGNEYFLGYPGDESPNKTSLSKLPRSAGSPYTSTAFVNSTAYQDVVEGSTSAIINDLLAAQAASTRAVAVLGLENPPALHQVGGANAYDFTKIDGVAVDTATAGDNINGTASSYINVVKGNYDYYYQNSFNTLAGTLGGTTTADLFANEFKAVMSSTGFVGADAGTIFPKAVPGTLIDADGVTSLGKGTTIATRNHLSPAPLQFHLNVPTTGIPASSEPFK